MILIACFVFSHVKMDRIRLREMLIKMDVIDNATLSDRTNHDAITHQVLP